MNRNVISIHAPHAGRDGVNIKIIDKLILFQSTRPMRGATIIDAKIMVRRTNFNPRAPCGARRLPQGDVP